VIGFDSGAPKEVAPPGYGSFVPYGDLDGLEALLRDVYATGGGLRPSSSCVEFATANYSLESMVASYEAIYQRLIESK
jgi:glycosyltransferase involved in cell wall biosynthesis